MELNGALSNPFTTDKSLLNPLSELQQKLLQQAPASPKQPRGRAARPAPVLELVTRVLECTGHPLRASEIHAAASQLHGRPLNWSSVKNALSAYTIGGDRRFSRVGYGIYELAS
jgi:hypothetical protein